MQSEFDQFFDPALLRLNIGMSMFFFASRCSWFTKN